MGILGNVGGAIGGGVKSLGRKIYKGTGSIKDGVGDLWNDATGVTASRDATRAQLSAGNEANQTLRDLYGQAMGTQRPYLEGGQQDYGRLREMMGRGAFDTPDFDPSNLQMDPGYQFRLSQGMKGLEGSAAARGGALSGGTLKALMGYGQDMASQEYQNAYGRAANTWGMNAGNRQAQYGRLSDMAGYGSGAANTMAALQTGLGQQISGNLLDMGNARAAGRMAQYNGQRALVGDVFGGALKAGGLFMGGGKGAK